MGIQIHMLFFLVLNKFVDSFEYVKNFVRKKKKINHLKFIKN